MLVLSCTFIGICLFILGSSGNGLCVLVFLRKKFRYRIITPYFITLLFVDSIYLLFRLMKLLYYSQTLFKLHKIKEVSCSKTLLARAYQYATQEWSQLLVPLIQSATYMRFALILMSIMSVQRMTFIIRSAKFLILPSTFRETNKYRWTISIIFFAFLLAYSFEFAGLTLFCSKSNNREITYNWFVYLSKHMANTTYILTNIISNQSKALKCVNYAISTLQQNETLFPKRGTMCTKKELMDILSYYFDQHQKAIVNLIQKIIFYQTGDRISRNDIRRKYHFHECIFPQEASFFHRYYDFMYSRIFGLNRHTLLLVVGSILPSIITIISNVMSVYRVRELNRLTSIYIVPCRRRTDDTRRVLLVITVECLFAIVNSWFSDIILSLIYCGRNLLAGDDCPMYLRQNYDLLVIFDFFNSASNIILHCLCGKRFRKELQCIFQSISQFFQHLYRDICCCYFQIDCRKAPDPSHISYNACITRHESSNSFNGTNHNQLYLKIHSSSRQTGKYCCDCRWYFNRKPFTASQQCSSKQSEEGLPNGRTYTAVRYTSLTEGTDIIRPTLRNSMRLYYPLQRTAESRVKKT